MYGTFSRPCSCHYFHPPPFSHSCRAQAKCEERRQNSSPFLPRDLSGGREGNPISPTFRFINKKKNISTTTKHAAVTEHARQRIQQRESFLPFPQGRVCPPKRAVVRTDCCAGNPSSCAPPQRFAAAAPRRPVALCPDTAAAGGSVPPAPRPPYARGHQRAAAPHGDSQRAPPAAGRRGTAAGKRVLSRPVGKKTKPRPAGTPPNQPENAPPRSGTLPGAGGPPHTQAHRAAAPLGRAPGPARCPP